VFLTSELPFCRIKEIYLILTLQVHEQDYSRKDLAMYKNLLLAILFTSYFSIINVNSQCPDVPVEFTTQSHVDQFLTDYPNCTSLIGLTISGSVSDLIGMENISSVGYLLINNNNALTNLMGLNNLETIWGCFEIENNTALTSFEGLDKLAIVDENVVIHNNDSITNFHGLDSLVIIRSFLRITDNDALISLNGFENLGNLEYGFIEIHDNISLISLSGLSKITTIGGHLTIRGNESLTSLNGLESLTSLLYNGFAITDNNALVSLEALENIHSINGPIVISNNAMLTNLIGLENIGPENITYLEIHNNPQLSHCEVNSICNALKILLSSSITIHDNATGCDSQAEVEAQCALLSTKDFFNGRSDVNIYPNPALDYISTTSQTGSSYVIINTNGLIMQKGTINANEQINISELETGIYFIQFDNMFFKRFMKR